MHLLSFDAVAAGVTWQEVFYRQLDQPGRWQERLILACAIWLSYTSDRLFDTFSLDTQKPRTERHQFIYKNRVFISVLWLVVFLSIIPFAFFNLPHRHFIGGLWITALVNAYFLLLRLSKTIPGLGSLKEILTAALFSIGVSYFPLLSLAGGLNNTLFLQLAFGLLCFSNVMLISHWEHRIDRGQQEAKLSQNNINRETLLKVLLLTLTILGFGSVEFIPGVFAWAFILSLTGIWCLHLYTARKGNQNLKFLIDAPLMLPFLLFLFF